MQVKRSKNRIDIVPGPDDKICIDIEADEGLLSLDAIKDTLVLTTLTGSVRTYNINLTKGVIREIKKKK
jgi:hypothetical protein